MIENNITRKIEATTDQIIRFFFSKPICTLWQMEEFVWSSTKWLWRERYPFNYTSSHVEAASARDFGIIPLWVCPTPTTVPKNYRHQVAHILAHIYQQSLVTAVVPDGCEIAKICTVFRKWGILQPRSISQYHEPVRPIRNLSTVCYRITLSIRNTILVS